LDVAETSWIGNSLGIFMDFGSMLTLENCLFAGNAAAFSGGLILGNQSAIRCRHATFADNVGRVFACSETPLELENTLLWPDPLSVCQGTRSTPPLITVDPQFRRRGSFAFGRFSPPDGNGLVFPDFVLALGDYRLRPSSPAVDAGVAGVSLPLDLDGHARPCGAGVDLGAYESGDCGGVPARFRRGDANADGRLNIADSVFTLLHLFAGGDAPSCADSADTDDSGKVDLNDAVRPLRYLFLGDPPLAPPFPDCGEDPSGDDLPCASQPACG
jgi:hypothetical protein